MRVKLSPAFISNAKCEPGAERSVYWDQALPGFGLVVTDTGHRAFVVQYRHEGRSRRMAINATLRLSEARKQARGLLGIVAKDRDPLAEKRKKEATAKNTLQSVCESYFVREGKKLRTSDERRRSLERLVYPSLGGKPVDAVRRSDISGLLNRIEDKNGAVMADRVLAYLRRVLNWHAAQTDDFKVLLVKGMARTKAEDLKRDRILTDDEIKKVWAAAGAMNNAFGHFVRFSLLTAVRRDEASRMRHNEIGDGIIEVDDGAGGKKKLTITVWTIPAARNKGKVQHVVPLSKAAQAVLAGVPVIGSAGLVFTHDGKRPLGGFSKFKKALDSASGVTDWRIHDLRRTARSLMSRANVPSDIAEMMLGHVLKGVRGTYDKYTYLPQKRIASEALAREIEGIIGNKIA